MTKTETQSTKGVIDTRTHTGINAKIVRQLIHSTFHPHTLPLMHTLVSFHILITELTHKEGVPMLELSAYTHSFPSFEGELQAFEAGAVLQCM